MGAAVGAAAACWPGGGLVLDRRDGLGNEGRRVPLRCCHVIEAKPSDIGWSCVHLSLELSMELGGMEP